MTKSFFKILSGSTAISLALSGTANADVNAQEVWDNWQDYASSFGQTFSVGSESTRGDTLTLQDVGISMEYPEIKMSGTIEFIELRELGNGTVEITMAPDFPSAVSINAPEGDEIDIGVIVRNSDLRVIASGDPGGPISYDYLASAVSVEIDKFFVAGEDLGPEIRFSMNGIDGGYTFADGDDVREISSDSVIASMTSRMKFTDPTNGALVDMTGSVSDLVMSSQATLPADLDVDSASWMFDGSFAGEGKFSSGPSQYQMNIAEGNNNTAIQADAASTSLSFSMEDGTIQYGGATHNIQYLISGSQIPVPQVEMAIADAAFNLKMPMGKSEAPKDFGFLTKISGLSISDQIWGMFDPGQVLPRDPATLIFDVAGAMNWLVDFTNPADTQSITPDGPAPFELHDLTINNVTLSFAGADITGDGQFSFDNTDLTTFDGMPAPDGTVNLTIVGVNGLMDNLTQMGFLPQEQAMGTRMMLGMFARPGDGPDTLTSTIEVKGDGSVFANGQQLK